MTRRREGPPLQLPPRSQPVSILTMVWFELLNPEKGEDSNWLYYALLPIWFNVWGVITCFTICVPVIRLVIGTYRVTPGSYPIHSWTWIRNVWLRDLMLTFNEDAFGIFGYTPLQKYLLRALGAKVGAGVEVTDSLECVRVPFHMLRLDENAFTTGGVSLGCYRVLNGRWLLEDGLVHFQKNAFLGNRSCVAHPCKLRPSSLVGACSYLSPFSIVKRNNVAFGIPAVSLPINYHEAAKSKKKGNGKAEAADPAAPSTCARMSYFLLGHLMGDCILGAAVLLPLLPCIFFMPAPWFTDRSRITRCCLFSEWVVAETRQVKDLWILVEFQTVPNPTEWSNVDQDTERMAELYSRSSASERSTAGRHESSGGSVRRQEGARGRSTLSQITLLSPSYPLRMSALADDAAVAPRKRKLPASLGLVPNGRAQVQQRSPVTAPAAAATAAASPSKRHATESTVRSHAAARAANQRADTDSTAATNLHLAAPAVPILRSPSPSSSSPPALVPLDADRVTTAADAAASSHARLAAASASSAAAVAAAPMRFTAAHSSLPFTAPTRSLPPPLPFDTDAASRPFPLLDLPADVLSVMVSFLQIWDACFLRGTAQAMRLISGLNGGATGPPVVQRRKPSTKRDAASLSSSSSSATAASASSDAMDSTGVGDDESADQFRFWHNYTSLDFRSLLQGWREFERQRKRICDKMAAASAASVDLTGATSVIELSPSPSPIPPESPLPNTITIFDSDEEDAGGNSGSTAAASSSSPAIVLSPPPSATSPEPASSPSSIDPYDRLQRVIAPYASGFPRLRTAALAPVGSHSRLSEDLCTSSEDDLWLLHFLRTHRLPFLTHLHFGYATLHSPLLSHLAAFCCSAPGSEVGTVKDLSLQFSEKSPGRWIETALRMGPLQTLSLDFTPSQKSVWPVLAPVLICSSMARTLQELKLVGPNTGAASLPPVILDLISAGLPLLRQVLVAHGLATTQLDFAAACRSILSSRRWPQLESLRLVHFPLIDDALPLFDAFAQRRCMHTLAVEQCINLRVPLVELPPKPVAASTASKKKKTAAARAESPPRAAAKAKNAEPTIPLAIIPRLPAVHALTLSHCGSLTVPSLRSLPLFCPALRRLDLSGHDSKFLSGSALKLLMDPALFGSLESLRLANCPQLDDHAWDGLPKKTRMLRLRELELSLGRTHRAVGPAVMKSSASAGRVQQHQDNSAIKKRFTDQGLSMLVVYCPALTALNLSGQSFLSAVALSKLFTRLSLLVCLSVQHHPTLDWAWIQSVLRAPVRHAMEVRMTMAMPLLHSAAAELLTIGSVKSKAPEPTAAAAAAASSSSPPPSLTRAPSKLTSNTSNAAILRTKLCQQLQQHVADITHRRVTLTLRM